MTTVGVHPRLKNAPIVEVVFELRAESSKSFALIPGALAAAFEPQYPNTKETPIARFAGLLGMGGAEEPMLMITHQFFRPDEKQFVQVGPGGMALNSVSYEGFDSFRDALASALKTYLAVAPATQVKRLGLRYINGLKAPGFEGLAISIEWPPLGLGPATNIAVRSVFASSDPTGVLAMAVGMPTNVGTSLDFDFFSEPRSPMTVEEMLSWADGAHRRVYEAFKAAVNPRLFESWR